MLKIFVLIISVIVLPNLAYSEEIDLFGDYNAAIRKKADAKNVNAYSAWGENISNSKNYNGRKVFITDSKNGAGFGNVYNKSSNTKIFNKTEANGVHVINIGK